MDRIGVAIVTGSGGMRGIGRAIALRLARAGYDIALVDIPRAASEWPQPELDAGWKGIDSVKPEIEALGRRALCIHADIGEPEQVRQACETTVRELGGIDVLVNNARALLGRDMMHVAELDIAEWDRVMRVNARGTLLMCQAAVRHFLAHEVQGRIINISSVSSKKGRPGHAAYSMSKFATNSLTQVLAAEVGPMGIRVNAVCPGYTDSGRFNLNEKVAAERCGTSQQEQHRAVLERQARTNVLGRIAVSEDVAGIVAFLVSPDAVHITGQAINVDGGEVFH